MSVWYSIFMGLVQGIAEFLPISSSGHLAIMEHFFGVNMEIPEVFDVLLHLGTLLAVFVAYWSDICAMVREFFIGCKDLAKHTTPKPLPSARRLILLIIVATIPLFAVLPIKDHIQGLGNNLYFVGGALLVTGFLLWLCDHVKKSKKNADTATFKDAVIVGICQAVATCPGISRSGTTITAGCFCGFDRSFAVRFSFLLSIPAVLGANILSLLDVIRGGVDMSQLPIYFIGVVVAAISGFASLRLLRFIASRGKFGAFAYYCWAVGALTIVLKFFGF